MNGFRPRHALFQSIHQVLVRIEANQEKIMSAQEDVNVQAAAIQAVAASLTTAAANIQQQIEGLNAQLAAPATVDTTALDSAVTALQQAQASVSALEAPAPADGGTDAPPGARAAPGPPGRPGRNSVSDKTVRAALEKLAKWRKFFASWQLGTTMAGDGQYKAVADHRELSILMRAEMTAVTGLLIRKGVFSQDEFRDALERSARQLDHKYEESYPGWRSLPDGLHMKLPEAVETMKEMGFPS